MKNINVTGVITKHQNKSTTKNPHCLRFCLNVNSVIIHQLKHICRHQHFISVINGRKKAPLKTHLQVQHGRIKFECNHCDHKANQRCNLKSHKGSVPTCVKSPPCSTQDPQVLLHYWLTSICPPQPQHEIQRLQTLHPCCNSIISISQNGAERSPRLFIMFTS